MDPNTHKTCPLCQQTLPLDAFGRCRDGYQPRCKSCRNQQRKERYKANQKKELEWRASYVAANPEKCAEYARQWRAANTTSDRERSRGHYQSNKGKLLSSQRQARETLADNYVRRVITGHKSYRGEDITAEHIDQVRQQILAKRAARADRAAQRARPVAKTGTEAELTDAYVRTVIKKGRRYAGEEITPEMIQAARERIQDKRRRREARAVQE